MEALHLNYSGMNSDYPFLEFVNTGTGSNAGALIFKKDNSSPFANDKLGKIILQGKDDTNNTVENFAEIVFSSSDVTSGSEDAEIQFKTYANGTLSNTLIVSSDKVGIGSITPSTLLYLEGSEPYLTLKNSTYEFSDGGCESKIIFENHSSNELANIKGSHDGVANDNKGDLIFSTNNGSSIQESFRVNSSQNVGIGHTAPTHNLHVSGSTRFDSEIGIKTDADSLYSLLVSGESRFVDTGEDTDSFVTYKTTPSDTGNNPDIGGVFRLVWDKGTANATYPQSNYNVEIHMRDSGSSTVGAVGIFENDQSLTSASSQINFTGQHRCLPSNNLDFNTTHVGKIVVSSGNYININSTIIPQITESLPLVELTSTEYDKKVFGVISDEADSGSTRKYGIGFLKTVQKKSTENEERIHINSVGEGSIWVCNKNGALENGDYITSSSLTGYGMKQINNEGILSNYTVAKITCDCNFSLTKTAKQKLKIVETNNIRNIDYDENNNYQYEDDLDENGNQQMVYPFDTVFLNSNGELLLDETDYNTRLTNGEFVYIACFVGCSYHCG